MIIIIVTTIKPLQALNPGMIVSGRYSGRGGSGKNRSKTSMKISTIVTSILAAALSGLTANACLVQVRIACPNDTPASGVSVTVEGVGSATTDNLGIAGVEVPAFATYTVCVDPNTLPAGATLSPLCVKIKVVDDAPPLVTLFLGGNFCSSPPPQGECWLTGGGTVGKKQGGTYFSFGGVVYPGCSPNAADGGNWNVVDHSDGLHFQGQAIVVDNCSGVPTGSPKVNVNIIDFHGTGILGVNGGDAKTPVSFVGRAIDNSEGGGGSDQLFIVVTDSSSHIVMQIGNSASDPATITTGNLQIHTTSCN